MVPFERSMGPDGLFILILLLLLPLHLHTSNISETHQTSQDKNISMELMGLEFQTIESESGMLTSRQQMVTIY